MSYKSYDKDKIKKNLSLEQVFQLIEFLGGNPKYIPQGFTAETICHNEIGLGSRKLYYYDNTKLFHCYTECGSMDIFEVFIRAKENKEKTSHRRMERTHKKLQYKQNFSK